MNAVWTYESPYAPVKEIAQHLAFYPNRVDSIDVQPAGVNGLRAHRSGEASMRGARHLKYGRRDSNPPPSA